MKKEEVKKAEEKAEEEQKKEETEEKKEEPTVEPKKKVEVPPSPKPIEGDGEYEINSQMNLGSNI